MRNIKVGETTYLAVDAASASDLLDLEPEEFWDDVTHEEYVELNKLVREIGTMPRGTIPSYWWFVSVLSGGVLDSVEVADIFCKTADPLRRVTSVKPQGNLVRPPGSVSGLIYPSAKTYIRGARGSDEEKP